MNFAKEKRLLLGWAALLTPIPLPLNGVLEWPVLFVYSFLVIYFLQRVEKGAQNWLPNWALNLLGIAYLPILAVDLRLALMRDQAVKALMHLILFLVVVKLFSIRREKEKWHVFLAIFFIFVAAMGTSSHLTVSFYLVGALILGFGIMARFAHFHMLATLGGEPARTTSFPPIRGSAVVSMLLVLLLAIPIFAAMPRLRQPFVMGQGGNNLGLARTTGFSDKVDLNLTTEIRGNRAVAMRMKLPPGMSAETLRMKAATYDYYHKQNWYRDLSSPRLIRSDEDGTLDLPVPPSPTPPFPTTRTGTIYLEPLDSTAVVLPINARSITPVGRKVRQLSLDPGGAVYFVGLPPRETVQYQVELGAGAYLAGLDVSQLEYLPADTYPSGLDERGITPRMRELADRVMGEGTDGEKARRLQAHLLENYVYTTDFVGRDGQSPLEDFLFEYKSGHCEYFASAMALMLRAEGIPARLVTGFLGAELNSIEDYYIVRQQNAHAWVEAWTGEEWEVFDPTPPEGRPAAAPRDLKLLVQQLYDYVAFRWDRYVLTYGAQDQRSFYQKVQERIAALRDQIQAWWSADDEGTSQRSQQTATLGDFQAREEAVPLWQRPQIRRVGLALFFAVLLGVAVYLRRRPLPVEVVYDRLRRGLSAQGLEIGPTTAPLDLRRLVESEHPKVAADLRTVVDVYIADAFAGRPPDPETLRRLRPALERILDGVARDLKERRKPRGGKTSSSQLDRAA